MTDRPSTRVGPLAGRRVVLTRPEVRSRDLVDMLAAAGADIIMAPMIRTESLAGSREMQETVARIGTTDWLVFTSAAGVEAFFEALELAGCSREMLEPVRIAAVGPTTAARVRQLGGRVDLVPPRYTSKALLNALVETGSVNGRCVVLPRSDIAPRALADGLRHAGAHVIEVAAYRTLHECALPAGLSSQLAAGAVDLVLFTSASTVRAFAAVAAREAREWSLAAVPAASIGPETSRALRESGIPVAVEADESTAAGLVRAAIRYLSGRDVASPHSEQEQPMSFPETRMRRLRKTPAIRRMVRETILSVDNLILPLFVREGISTKVPIGSLEGHAQWPADAVAEEARAVADLGIPAVLVFGVPEHKDAAASSAYRKDAVVCRAVENIKKARPELTVITDVCLCAYTDHGHCGVIRNNQQGMPVVDNDRSLELISRQALAHAGAGTDMVAPSDMMDGRVRAIRRTLDEAGLTEVAIMAYSAKHASAFYGPFREAADSAPQFGDRTSYQMDPANGREALREIQLDIEEGADIVMVKPALAYLDVIRAAVESFAVPVAAYNVSGEYAMVKAAAARGWVDEKRAALEILTGIRRAGARMIITYWAKDAAGWLAR